jgi:exoribonuclease-2
MFALFDEAGKFLAGRILSEAEASLQVELDTGKRVKVKTANLLLKFEKPAPAALLDEARRLAADMELSLAWEFAPEDDFGFAELAAVYFQDPPSLTEQAAALLRLHEAPHYFRRAGKGRYKKAPAEIIQQALAAIEKKRLLQIQINEWAEQLAQGHCPEPIREQLYKILFKPDKNAPEYKAVVEAARATQKAPLPLLQAAGAIDSPYQFHWRRFLFDNFPKGYGFPSQLVAPEIKDELPTAEVRAYSIDDSLTTEIDDALSVQGLGSGTVTVGVHIAAPGLAVQRGDAIDKLGRDRLSTVYMPGYKITMLPDEVVQRYTLQEGQACPAVSLYVRFSEETLEVLDSETKLERVPIVHNLRHDQLDGVVTQAWLTDPAHEPAAPVPALLTTALRAELSFLHRLALHLKAQREVVRGKPETFNRPDYNFRLGNATGEEPRGDETVQISVRQRGAALDIIVAEAMILANSRWGQWLADLGVPAIYRSQASLAPGVKVRMGTKALPHAGIGVPCYAWSTSPLRRYTDLVNQWQIIACARHGKTAALAAPFKPSTQPTRPTTATRPPLSATGPSSTSRSKASASWTSRCSRTTWPAPTPCPWCCPCWASKGCRAARGCGCGSARSTKWRWTSAARSSRAWMRTPAPTTTPKAPRAKTRTCWPPAPSPSRWT